MPETNIKQAYIPTGSEKLINTQGTAPGIRISKDGLEIEFTWVTANKGPPLHEPEVYDPNTPNTPSFRKIAHPLAPLAVA